MTWDALLKREELGPGICCLCLSDSESMDHLFVHCSFWQKVWSIILDELKMDETWGPYSIDRILENWCKKLPNV